jgi:uncharacterized protein (TIRG00374 family)
VAKKWLWRLAPWLIAVGLLVWVERIIPLDETWATLRGLTWMQIGALILLNGLILILLNGRWWFILRGQGYPVPFLQLFGYRLAGFGVSYFTPGPHFGGEPLQIYLLQKRHGLPRSTAVASIALDKSLELWVNFAFLAGGMMVALSGRILPNLIEEQFLILALGLLALPTLFLGAIWSGYAPMSWLTAWMAGWPVWRRWQRTVALWDWLPGAVRRTEAQITDFCRRQPYMLLAAFLVSLLSWLIVFGEYWLVLSLMGMSLSSLQVITALVALRLTLLLPLPGGLGGMEAGQILVLGLLGQSQAAALSAGLLIRARDVTMGLLGLWWGWVVTPQRGKSADFAD